MKKLVLFIVSVTTLNYVGAQELSLSYNNKPNHLVQKFSKKEVSAVDRLNLSSEKYASNSNAPAREFYRKEIMKQGALKGGTSYGAASTFIFGADTTLFDSEVTTATIPFVKSTQVPFLAVEYEYMITEKFAAGGFVGYTQSESSNRGSDGVNQKYKTNGFLYGVHGSFIRPLTSWLYLPIYVEFVYEKGKLDGSNGQIIEKYAYQRTKPSLGFGLELVFSEYIQISLRGFDISRSNTEFVQTNKTISNSTTTNIDQSQKSTDFKIASNPRIRVLFNVLNTNGKSNR